MRYSNLDVGHAWGSIKIAARLLGWQIQRVKGISDNTISKMFGLNQNLVDSVEKEHPGMLLIVIPSSEKIESFELKVFGENFINEFEKCTKFFGQANVLSESRTEWKLLKRIVEVTENKSSQENWRQKFFEEKKEENSEENSETSKKIPESFFPSLNSTQIFDMIRVRRSSTNFEKQSTSKENFFGILSAISQRNSESYHDLAFPFDGLNVDIRLEAFAIYVMRVDGLPEGLYLLVQSPSYIQLFREHYKNKEEDGFCFELVDSSSPLNLFCVKKLDQEKSCSLSKYVSCSQLIAHDCCFTIGMLSPLSSTTLEEKGLHSYRHIHWVGGVVGQLLYL